MKNNNVILALVVLAAFARCSTEVDMYAEYKQVPIIYGLLEARSDTNFIKLTRSFYTQGDAYQTAINPDSSNYAGKLDVRLVEYRNGDSIREIILDTITKHDKEQGIFYAPHQKLYYTTERLRINSESYNYTYRLKAVLPDRILTAKAQMVGDNRFGVKSLGVNFSKQYIGMSRRFKFYPAINAKFYDVSMAFTFYEQRTPESDSVPRTMQWRVGSYHHDDLASNSDSHGNYLIFYYDPRTFYEKLEEFIGGDTAVAGLKRYIVDYPVEVIITAGGEKLWLYILINNESNSMAASENSISLIEGAQGVFSSRITTQTSVRLAGETVPDLLDMDAYGFVFIGGSGDVDDE